jgi:hypothetical protein
LSVAQVMRDDEAADRIIARHAGIADDVWLARLKPEQILHIEPHVHARPARPKIIAMPTLPGGPAAAGRPAGQVRVPLARIALPRLIR